MTVLLYRLHGCVSMSFFVFHAWMLVVGVGCMQVLEPAVHIGRQASIENCAYVMCLATPDICVCL
jgi:hypothetical protein